MMSTLPASRSTTTTMAPVPQAGAPERSAADAGGGALRENKISAVRVGRIRWRIVRLLDGYQAKLVIGQMAGRVGGPEIAREGFGSHSRPARAQVKEGATRAAPTDVDLAVPEPGQQRLDRVAPDLLEGARPHTAKGVMGPELVGMHLATIIHVRNGDAGRVAAPPPEQLMNEHGGLRPSRAQPEVQQHPISIVISRHEVEGHATVVKRFGAVKDHLHGRASLRRRQRGGREPVSAANVNQVAHVATLDPLGLHEVEDTTQVRERRARECEAKPDREPYVPAVTEPSECLLVGAAEPAEAVVERPDAVH